MASLEAHEFAVHDALTLNYIRGCGASLLIEATTEPAFLVDSNVDWKALANGRPNVRFLLGRTLSDERENLQSELFGKRALGGFRNVFVVGIEGAGDGRCFVVHRLDPHYGACNTRPLPPLSQMSAAMRDEFNSAKLRRHTADRVLALVKRGDAKLRGELAELLPLSARNYLLSAAAAEHAFALSIATRGSREAGKELRKLQTNHANALGDARLIQEALFLGIGVISTDRRDVWNMCRLAGVPVIAPADLAAPNSIPTDPATPRL